MLVQKLRADDLQSEKGSFDGVMVYAQNKVPSEIGGKHKLLSLTCHYDAGNAVKQQYSYVSATTVTLIASSCVCVSL